MKTASVANPGVPRSAGLPSAASSETHKGDANHASASVSSLARNTLESLVDLVGAQIRLAKTELALDARKAATKAGAISLFLPMVLVGYVMLCFALAALLAQVMPTAGALAIVGGLQVLVGVGGTFLMVQRLRRLEALDRTKESVDESVSQVGAAMSAPTHSTPRH